MRLRRAVLPPAGELEVRVGSGEREEDAVVTLVVLEPAELRQAEPLAVETDDLLEALRVSSEAHLHRRRAPRR
jgi:hypothetical protein